MAKEPKSNETVVIDGKGRVLGRVGSRVAKMLLENKNVALINAEDVVISGHIREITSKYKRRFELQDKANPEHSPYWSRRSDLFVKRVIRGMLPYKQPKGKKAYKLLRVYLGVPEELKSAKPVVIESKNPDGIFENTFTVKEILAKL